MSQQDNANRPDTVESSSRSSGQRQGRGGRGRGRGWQNQAQQSNSPRFQGQEPSLKECIFDYSEDPQSKRYLRNVELLIGYVGSNFDRHNQEFQQALEALELPDPEEATKPKDPTDMIQVEEWKMAYKARQDQMVLYKNFRAALYSLIMGQCTPLLKDKLQAHETFGEIKKMRDGVDLLKLIKQITFTFDSGRIFTLVARDKLKEDFYSLRRRNNQSLHSYYEVFRAKVKVINEAGIVLYNKDMLERVAQEKKHTTPSSDDHEDAQNRCIAIRFIRSCGNKEYEAHLQNMFLDGQNVYPKTLANARAILDNRMTGKPKNNPGQSNGQPDNATGVAYVTSGETSLPDSTMTGHSNATTATGAHASGSQASTTQSRSNRTNSQAEGNNESNRGVLTSSNRGSTVNCDSPDYVFSSSTMQASIPPQWLLLDNQSTVDIIKDPSLLKNIHSSETPIIIQSHAGQRTLQLRGLLPGYGIVWHDPEGPANIISLNNAHTRFHIKYDSDRGNSFALHDRATGRLKHKFNPSPEGLFYLDTSTLQSSFVTTVSENEDSYSPEEIRRAKLARSLLAKIGRPSTKDYLHILRHNLLPNANITTDDVYRAEKIYGPDLGTLKGKTTRRKSPFVDTSTTVPPRIAEKHKDVTLTIDVMHVNNVPFLVTTSRKIHFGTIDAIQSTTDTNIIQSLKKTVAVYRRGGIRPRIVLADGAFTSDDMQASLQLLGITINSTARDEHVGDVERYIRTVKERMRCVYNTLPFDALPKVMLIELAKFATFWLNCFPHHTGISKTQSPRLLVTGEHVDFNKHCRYEFGQYVQCHEQHDNTMAPRTIGAIALRPTGNRQGSYYFLSLTSGRVITRNHATALPMPAEVIQRVHQLAQSQEMQPGLAFGNRDNRILFLDENNELFDDDDESYEDVQDMDEDLRYDDDLVEDELAEDDVPDVENVINEPEPNQPLDNLNLEPLEIQGVGAEANLPDPVDNEQYHDAHEQDSNDSTYDDALEDVVMDMDADEEDEGRELAGGVEEENKEEASLTEEDLGMDVDPEQENNNQPENEPRYNLRPNRQRSYAHRYGHSYAAVDKLQHGRYDGYLRDGILYLVSTEINMATPQMPMKKGIKLFGDKGVAAVKVEIQQLHDRGVLRAVHKTDLTWNQVQEALGYLMFLKRKRCGKIKGRGCADGRKQRAYIDKPESASPTVATESVFITAVIDALERRVVAVADIPGAFMHSDMDPDIYMRLDGLMAELLLEVDYDTYAPFLTYEKGQPVIYVEMLKALYGTLRAARLFWEKLTAVLKSWGFVINPYDSCVANKQVNDRQLTVTWHIDDLKVSHVDGKVVHQFLDDLRAEFGQLGEISVSEGTRHDYLGMFLDYGEDGVVQVDMRSYLETILLDLPKEWIGRARSPAAKHLYHVNPKAHKLDETKSDRFHSVTMQLAYMAQRGRPDIRTAVTFLSTRVMAPDDDDYRKLGRVLKYLQSTRDLILRLEGDPMMHLWWWVDASYATHPDLKGHTGGFMTMGKGAVVTASSKQKLVARSSTECELIGIHDVLPSIIWTKNFIQAQGHEIKDVTLHQDNQSSILLAKNGRLSSSKRTKHINLRYFYITDCIKRKEMDIAFCPTEEMVADFFTKPLQGRIFYQLRDIIMNVPSDSKYHSSAQRSVLRIAEQPVNIEDQGATGATGHSQDIGHSQDAESWTLVCRRGKSNERTNKRANAHSMENT